LISSLLIRLTPLADNIRMPNGEHRFKDLSLRVVWQDFKRGFTYILNNKLLLALPLIHIAIGGWMPSIIAPEMMGRVQGWINPLMMLAQSITLGVISICRLSSRLFGRGNILASRSLLYCCRHLLQSGTPKAC